MLLEIRLKNFFSIKEEVVLDLRSANINTRKAKSLSKNLFHSNNTAILKTIAIYGANASGKSNIIKAIRFCNAMIFESHRHNENTIYNFKPFKFAGYNNKPSEYFISFILENIEYEYSFSLTRDRILNENLYYYPHGRKAKIFTRDETKGKTKKDKYTFSPSVIKRPFDVASNTSDKTLFISRASQLDRNIPKEIYRYFNNTFILDFINYSNTYKNNLINDHKSDIIKALKNADSDIVDFKQKLLNVKLKEIRANPITEEAYFGNEVEGTKLEIKTYHKPEPNIPFEFYEESKGTQRFFYIILTILHIIKYNKILLIDEIENSLHPKILEFIIKTFHASKNSQLIFTTHNTQLLNLDTFRKDQIWFVNKKENGASDLYSLYDYKDFRDKMNAEKAYLQGRFDAIPIIYDLI